MNTPLNAPKVIRVGMDEVGRGSLYGPLVVGIVANVNDWTDPQVGDSKTIKSKRREEIAKRVKENTTSFIDFTEANLIDRYGMGACLSMSFQRLISKMDYYLSRANAYFEARYVVDGEVMGDLTTTTGYIEFLPKADALVFEVGAASIVAKVAHDTWIRHQCQLDPTLNEYGFESNMGYHSDKHMAALFNRGSLTHHRTHFVNTAMATARAKKRSYVPA